MSNVRSQLRASVVVGIALCHIGAAVAQASNGCPSLIGDFSYTGQWLDEPSQPENIRPPSIGEYAFGFALRQVIRPEAVRVAATETVGLYSVSVLSYKEALPGASPLEHLVAFNCADGAWRRRSESRGGGENTPSVKRGAHARSAVGLAELPFNIPVEIEGEVELVPYVA
jgi:hypothetical protein